MAFSYSKTRTQGQEVGEVPVSGVADEGDVGPAGEEDPHVHPARRRFAEDAGGGGAGSEVGVGQVGRAPRRADDGGEGRGRLRLAAAGAGVEDEDARSRGLSSARRERLQVEKVAA